MPRKKKIATKKRGGKKKSAKNVFASALKGLHNTALEKIVKNIVTAFSGASSQVETVVCEFSAGLLALLSQLQQTAPEVSSSSKLFRQRMTGVRDAVRAGIRELVTDVSAAEKAIDVCNVYMSQTLRVAQVKDGKGLEYIHRWAKGDYSDSLYGAREALGLLPSGQSGSKAPEDRIISILSNLKTATDRGRVLRKITGVLIALAETWDIDISEVTPKLPDKMKVA